MLNFDLVSILFICTVCGEDSHIIAIYTSMCTGECSAFLASRASPPVNVQIKLELTKNVTVCVAMLDTTLPIGLCVGGLGSAHQ